MLPPLRMAVSVAVAVALVLRVVTVVTVAKRSRTGPTARGGWPDVAREVEELQRGRAALQAGREGSGGSPSPSLTPRRARRKGRRVHSGAWRADAMLTVALRLGLALQRRKQALVPRVRLVRLEAQVRAGSSRG